MPVCEQHDRFSGKVTELLTLVHQVVTPQQDRIELLLTGPGGNNGLVAQVQAVAMQQQEMLRLLRGDGADKGVVGRIERIEQEQQAQKDRFDRLYNRLWGVVLGVGLTAGGAGFGLAQLFAGLGG